MAGKTAEQGADAPLYREFEHTGDMGIEVWAPTRAELFRRASIALGSLLVERAGVSAIERREVAVRAESDADLMHDLLAELLDLFVVDAFIWRDAVVEEQEGGLRAIVEGEKFDPSRHEFLGEIKAVTYHQLSVEHLSDRWTARVIFDV